MAYSKIILNGETLMDVTSDTVDADGLADGVTATKNDGTKVEGTILPLYQSDLVVDGRKVTVPAGYYTFTDTSKNVSSTTHPNPAATIASSTGVVTAAHTQGTGYVTSGTTTGTLNLATQAAQTLYPSTVDQTISSYRWLTGTQTIKSVTTSNLTAENIAEGVVVKVGDSNNASRITQITGTHSGGGGGFTVDEIAMRTISGMIYGQSASYVPAYAFADCSIITGLSFPEASYIGSYAFRSCGGGNVGATWTKISICDFPKVTSVSQYAFYDASLSCTANFPLLTSIQSNAFLHCTYLTEINASNVTYIGSSAFYSCFLLRSAYFPNVSLVSNNAFYNCSSLSTASFNNVSTVSSGAFSGCDKLASFYAPNITSIGYSAFMYCSSLVSLYFPNVKIIGNGAFAYCVNLTTISIYNCTSIGSSAFRFCYNLISLYLNSVSSVPSMGATSIFYSTPISNYSTSAGRYGSIFVPSSLYTAFTTAAGWSLYSARMVSV